MDFKILRQKGAVLVEAVLILPVFILMIVFFFELVFYFHTDITILNAASQGARYASLASTQTEAEIIDKTTEYLNAMGISADKVAITVSAPSGLNTVGESITLRIAMLNSILIDSHSVAVVVRKEGAT